MKTNLLSQILIVMMIMISSSMCLFGVEISTRGEQSSTIQQHKRSDAQVSLSFTLFHKLYSMSANQVVQYLRKLGCKVNFDQYSNSYSADVRGGTILIFPSNYKTPRLGIGAIQFITTDPNVCKAWYRGLAKAGYNNYGDEIWYGDTGHWPSFGVRNMIEYDEIYEDFTGSGILYIQAFPMRYNEKTGTYE